MIRSVLLPRHEAEKARVRIDADPPQLLTYGDVPAEYRAAQEAAVVFDETQRGRIEAAKTPTEKAFWSDRQRTLQVAVEKRATCCVSQTALTVAP